VRRKTTSLGLCVWTLIVGLTAPRTLAEEPAKPVKPNVAGTALSGPSGTSSIQDLYTLCAFYPKRGSCETVYRKAMSDNSIFAQAVRAEYTGYARYLGGSGSLTDTDKKYLRENGIMVPSDLSSANQAGLHNVISDPGLTGEKRPAAVNNFLSRAVEAEIYCGLNGCEESSGASSATGTSSTGKVRSS